MPPAPFRNHPGAGTGGAGGGSLRKLLALLVLALALGGLAQEPLLPQRIGDINDYGQTLERTHREELAAIGEQLAHEGLHLVYLASWRDPFGSPEVYAREVFLAWGLGPDSILLVFLRDEGGRWHVTGHLGAVAAGRIPQKRFGELLAQAERETRRAPPAKAVLALGSSLLALAKGGVPVGERSGGTPFWVYVLAVLAGGGGAYLCLRRWFCPHCLLPLRRRQSWRGIILVCPRCGYTRAQRRGRGTGSRRGPWGP